MVCFISTNIGTEGLCERFYNQTSHGYDSTVHGWLSKFQTSSKDIYDWASIVMPVGKQISIENLHWVFETENPTFIQKLMGNKEQTFYCFCTSLNPCDLYVLVYCIVNSSTKWSVNLTSRDMTDKCMKMLFLVEEGKAFHYITSLKLSGNTILTSIASLLGTSIYACVGSLHVLEPH